ncbi:hypothetical protein [Georgenia sp. SYP-B2076]|uniref:hypothetical protein n=1 Tax=Georgenia sp. SYP-B2076 TaxID=2495881 RepID=UPI000F8EC608|nr:hypothetical protein [Georgenia sp. SYP-B2076]
MTAAVLAGALTAAAVLLARPPRRSERGRPLSLRGRSLAAPHGAARRAGGPRRAARWRRGRGAEVDLGVIVTEVATRLRTGSGVEAAWAQTFARAGLAPGNSAGTEAWMGDDGVPAPLLELAARQEAHERLPRPLRRFARGHTRRGPPWPAAVGATTAGALPGALAACRLTHEIGAPLAEVLERCAQGITEAGHAQAARAIALAGPRSSARLLGWLPVLGLGLGVAVGADPFHVLLDGGLGTACLLLGGVLLVLGRRWVAALERAARTSADGRPP